MTIQLFDYIYNYNYIQLYMTSCTKKIIIQLLCHCELFIQHMCLVMMMMMMMMNWMKGIKLYFQPGPLSEILTITNLWHTASRIWTCSEPEFRLCWMKLCSSDNHYTMAPRLKIWLSEVVIFYLLWYNVIRWSSHVHKRLRFISEV